MVVVSVDGLRSDAITAEIMPRLHRRLAESAYTLAARTVVPSLTLPAHVSLLSGLTPDRHQVLWNSYRPGLGPVQVRTVFDAAHEAGLATALFGGKEKLRHLAVPGVLDLVSVGDRRDEEVMEEALGHIREARPHVTLVHLPDADRAGHASGWLGERQLGVLEKTDVLLGRLFDLLSGFDPHEGWAVILTADHGGHGFGHHGGKPTDVTIPWLVWGGGVEPRELSPLSITDTALVLVRVLGLDEKSGQPAERLLRTDQGEADPPSHLDVAREAAPATP